MLSLHLRIALFNIRLETRRLRIQPRFGVAHIWVYSLIQCKVKEQRAQNSILFQSRFGVYIYFFVSSSYVLLVSRSLTRFPRRNCVDFRQGKRFQGENSYHSNFYRGKVCRMWRILTTISIPSVYAAFGLNVIWCCHKGSKSRDFLNFHI